MRYALLLLPLIAACSTPAPEPAQVEFIEELSCVQVPPPPATVQSESDGLSSAATDSESKPSAHIPAPFGAGATKESSMIEDAKDEVHEDPSDKPDFDIDIDPPATGLPDMDRREAKPSIRNGIHRRAMEPRRASH